MAELRDEHSTGLSEDRLTTILGSLIQVADLILRIFGKRKSDRPQRDPGMTAPPR